MEDSDTYSSSSSSTTSDDDEASDADVQEEPSSPAGAELAGTSGFTLGGSEFRERRSRDRERRWEEELAKKVKSAEEKTSASAPSDGGDESVTVGEDVWVALEIAFHGDGWGESCTIPVAMRASG